MNKERIKQIPRLQHEAKRKNGRQNNGEVKLWTMIWGYINIKYNESMQDQRRHHYSSNIIKSIGLTPKQISVVMLSRTKVRGCLSPIMRLFECIPPLSLGSY